MERKISPKHLSRCKLLKRLSNYEKQLFLDAGTPRRILAGNYFFYQDEEASKFYILVKGKVRLTQITPEGNQVILHYAQAGEGIGIIVALSHARYPVSAEAVEDCKALGWDGNLTKEFMLQYPRLTLNGLDLVTRQFVQLQDRYRKLATERVERRVAHMLLRLNVEIGEPGVNGDRNINLPLSRQDLAEMTGTTLYTVSRILSQWEKRGLVITGRNRVATCNSQGLQAIAEDTVTT